jgi:hypothetical protein
MQLVALDRLLRCSRKSVKRGHERIEMDAGDHGIPRTIKGPIQRVSQTGRHFQTLIKR